MLIPAPVSDDGRPALADERGKLLRRFPRRQSGRVYLARRMDGFHLLARGERRFAETDAQAIAHHASFLVWFEVARVAYLAAYAGGYRRSASAGSRR